MGLSTEIGLAPGPSRQWAGNLSTFMIQRLLTLSTGYPTNMLATAGPQFFLSDFVPPVVSAVNRDGPATFVADLHGNSTREA